MSAHGTGAFAPRHSDNALIRGIGALSTLCGWAAAAMIVASVAITCQMIFVRFVLRQSTIWQTEAVIYLMIGATLIGLPYVQRLRGHVNVDLLPLLLPPAFRMALAFVVLLASLGVVGILLWHGYEMWHLAFERGWKSDTVWGVRLWIPYLAIPVGLGLFALQLAADLLALAIGEERPFGLDPEATLASGPDMADATTGEPAASPLVSNVSTFARPPEGHGPPRFSRARGTRRERQT